MTGTKKSLIASGISLAVSVALLAGSTFAWFTDSVVNKGNTIQAGNLKVDFKYKDLDDPDAEYVPVPDNAADAGKALFNSANWEPGYSFGYDFEVTNKGSLAFDWTLTFENVKSIDGVPDDGKTANIADVIDVYVIEDENKNDLTGEVPKGTLSELSEVNGGTLVKDAAAEEFSVVLKMQDGAGNEYQNGSVTFDIYLRAKQAMSEQDGFGSSKYDEDAVYQQVNVEYDENKTPEENGKALQNAIVNAKPGETVYISEGTYDIPRDDVTEVNGQSGWYFAITSDNVHIVGEEGAVITSDEFSANGAWSSQNMVTIVGDNVTLEGFTIKCKMDSNKAIEVYGKNSVIRDVKILCNDVTTHEEYLEQKGIEAGSENDYWSFYRNEFAGSLCYNGDIGNAKIENVYIDKAWLTTTNVQSGTVSVENVTVNFEGCGYAGISGYNPISKNVKDFVNVVDSFVLNIDEKTNLKDLIDIVPENTTVNLAEGTYDVTTAASTNTQQTGGFIVSTPNITIKGEPGSIIKAQTTGGNGGNWEGINQQNTMTIMADNVTLDGLTFLPIEMVTTGNNIAPKALEVTNAATNFTLKNCTFESMAMEGEYADIFGENYGGQISINTSKDSNKDTIKILNNTFNYAVLDLRTAATIDGNTFISNSQVYHKTALRFRAQYDGSGNNQSYSDITMTNNVFSDITPYVAVAQDSLGLDLTGEFELAYDNYSGYDYYTLK